MRMIAMDPASMVRAFSLGLVLLAPSGAAQGAQDPADLCERAATRAAAATGVPLAVLRTIALVESGRADGDRTRPWPWTANFGGQGVWYSNRAEAELAVEERLSMGATNIDIGCFQINQRWHGAAFPGVSAMFDPDSNALYAARFLAQLYDETGTWSDAAAAYHSRTPGQADVYRARFEAMASTLDEPSPARVNRFPLLQSGAVGAIGSLVPQVEGMGSLLGAQP